VRLLQPTALFTLYMVLPLLLLYSLMLEVLRPVEVPQFFCVLLFLLSVFIASVFYSSMPNANIPVSSGLESLIIWASMYQYFACFTIVSHCVCGT